MKSIAVGNLVMQHRRTPNDPAQQQALQSCSVHSKILPLITTSWCALHCSCCQRLGRRCRGQCGLHLQAWAHACFSCTDFAMRKPSHSPHALTQHHHRIEEGGCMRFHSMQSVLLSGSLSGKGRALSVHAWKALASWTSCAGSCWKLEAPRLLSALPGTCGSSSSKSLLELRRAAWRVGSCSGAAMYRASCPPPKK